MYRTAPSNRVIGFAASTAMAAALLGGCATNAAPRADLSASQAEAALASGKHAKAIDQAEAAVLADPRNPSYRALLGQTYLEAGRFASAATSFDDAVALGDQSGRTALSLSIAMMGQGRQAEAAALLNAREDDLPAADVGLALALAGQPDRGIHLMSNAIRAGRNDAKIRQNLAYAYALAGRWREARLMAAQDVPADQVGERIEQWASTVQPEAWQQRIAGLLDVPVGVADAGQPVHLALANSPSAEQLAGVSAEPAELEVADELPALAVAPAPVQPELPAVVPAPLPATFQTAFTAPTPAPVAQDAQRFAEVAAPRPAAASAAVAPAAAASSTHLVQLGSFSSEQSARRAWDIYVKRYPELSGHQMVISEAVVRGKNFWRVSAAGYDRGSSSAMCGKVKSRGDGCFAYAEGRPLPGAVDRGTRMAMR